MKKMVFVAVPHYSVKEPEIIKFVMFEEFMRCRNILTDKVNLKLESWNDEWRISHPTWNGNDPDQLQEYDNWIADNVNEEFAKSFNESSEKSKIIEIYMDGIIGDYKAHLRWNKKSTLFVTYTLKEGL